MTGLKYVFWWSLFTISLVLLMKLLFCSSNFYFVEGSSTLLSLIAGAQLALEYCQQEFQWERWNCPGSVFSRKGRQLQTRETSFVSAITAAGIIYSVARNCSRGQLAGCGCHNSTHSKAFYGNGSFQVHCMDDLVYAEQVAAEFLQSLELTSKDSPAAIDLHNFVVGKEAVRESLHQECKCKGVFDFCPNKSCKMKVGPFQDITKNLRQRYKRARRINWNSVSADTDMLGANQLLYLAESPDYCQPNNTTDWPGTVGRTCTRMQGPDVSPQARRSCRKLCRSCGHKVRHRQSIITYQCNCKFHWSFKVTCQQCTKVVQQYYCDVS